MNFVLTYIIDRFFYRFLLFFYHWYINGFSAIADNFMKTLKDMDKTFAVAITLRYFFEPLYKDYSIVGRILGIIFRSGRVLIGFVVYFFTAMLFLCIYIIWALIPIILIYHGIKGY
jgi:hypothetical protein